MRRTPALIIGGGPAGAAVAIVLATAGAPHLLVERTRETGDALCGGFLSWRTLETLAAFGVDADRLNRADVTRVRLIARDRCVEARLPRAAKAVSRRRLDSMLLEVAEARGAAIERGATVRGIEDMRARIDGADIDTDALFLASGKHDVRGAARPAETGDDPTLGLRIRLAASPTLTRLVGDAVELHLVAGGYAGVALQEDGSANVCLAIARSRLQAAGSPRRLLDALAAEAPMLGDRLAALAGDATIDAVANVPYGWIAGEAAPDTFRLGDQLAVIPSLAGEGMGIALASGAAAARAHLADTPAPRWQRDFARQVARPVRIADLVRHALDRPALARALLPAARMPGLVGLIARVTRVPGS